MNQQGDMSKNEEIQKNIMDEVLNQKKTLTKICNTLIEIRKENKQLKMDNTTLKTGMLELKEKVKLLETQNVTILKNIENNKETLIPEVEDKIKTYTEVVSKGLKESTESITVLREDIKMLEDIKVDIKESTENITVLREGINNVQSTIDTKSEENKELKEIEAKKKNVLVFNIPESSQANEEKKYKEDIANFKTIIKNKINIENKEINQMYRLGSIEKAKAEGKIRPIVIKFNTIETKQSILKLRNLKLTKENNETINIYIASDKTIKQQEQYKRLKSELDERREKGETDLVIRNGSIQKRQPFRFAPKDYWEG